MQIAVTSNDRAKTLPCRKSNIMTLLLEGLGKWDHRMKMAECRMHGKQKSHRLFLHSPKMIRGLLRLRAVFCQQIICCNALCGRLLRFPLPAQQAVEIHVITRVVAIERLPKDPLALEAELFVYGDGPIIIREDGELHPM